MAKTLLLADDSVTIQKVVGITFANEDVELITVDNGDDALARARELRPDAILADVSMPGLDGYALCAEIKRDPSLAHIPVLLLTGTFEPFDAARASEVQPDGHIAKPFEAQVLIDQVFRLLQAGPAPAAPPEPLAPAPPPPAEIRLDAPEESPRPEAFPPPPLSGDSEPLAPGGGLPLEASLPASETREEPAWADPPEGAMETLETAPLAESIEDAPDATRIFDPTGADLVAASETPHSPDPLAPSDPLDPRDPIGRIGDEEFDLEDPPDLMLDVEPVRDDRELAEPDPADSGSRPREPAQPRESEGWGPGTSDVGIPAQAMGIGDGADSTSTPLLGVEEADLEAAGIDPDPSGGGYADSADERDETPITPFLNLARDRADLDDLPEIDALPEDDLPWLEPEPESTPEPDAWAPSSASSGAAQDLPGDEDSAAGRGLGLSPPDAEALRQVLEKMAWEAFGPLTERLVSDVVRKVEEVAWEVIPELADRLIRAEIERLKSED
ncbi:MAG: response regulator [Myxococcota bacterium]